MSDQSCSQPGCEGFAADGFLCIDHFMALPLFLRMGWHMAHSDKSKRLQAEQDIFDYLSEKNILKDLGF